MFAWAEAVNEPLGITLPTVCVVALPGLTVEPNVIWDPGSERDVVFCVDKDSIWSMLSTRSPREVDDSRPPPRESSPPRAVDDIVPEKCEARPGDSIRRVVALEASSNSNGCVCRWVSSSCGGIVPKFEADVPKTAPLFEVLILMEAFKTSSLLGPPSRLTSSLSFSAVRLSLREDFSAFSFDGWGELVASSSTWGKGVEHCAKEEHCC